MQHVTNAVSAITNLQMIILYLVKHTLNTEGCYRTSCGPLIGDNRGLMDVYVVTRTHVDCAAAKRRRCVCFVQAVPYLTPLLPTNPTVLHIGNHHARVDL